MGYIILAVLGIAFIPLLYPAARWYYILVCYLLAPLLAIPNGGSHVPARPCIRVREKSGHDFDVMHLRHIVWSA